MFKTLMLSAIIALISFGASADQIESELPVITLEEFNIVDGVTITPATATTIENDPSHAIVDTESLFVIESGFQKDAAAWTADDSAACKSRGGVELPISAGRIACFLL